MIDVFRIAIGDCSAKAATRSPVDAERQTGEAVDSRIDRLRALSRQQLINLPVEDREIDWSSGGRIEVTTYHHKLEYDQDLLVVQAFRRTMRWPNWISLYGIGQLVAEGIVVLPDGSIEDAADKVLWGFR